MEVVDLLFVPLVTLVRLTLIVEPAGHAVVERLQPVVVGTILQEFIGNILEIHAHHFFRLILEHRLDLVQH